MARMSVRRGVMIGVACVLTAAGMAEAGGKGNGGGKNNGGSKGYSSGGSHSGNNGGNKNNGYKNNGNKNNGHHHGSKNSGSSSSFSISIGSGYYGSGYSVGYGYSSGGWCAPRPRAYVAPVCGPRYGYGYSYGYARPSYICGPRYVVREYAPTYVVIDRPAPVQYIVSDASSATPTVISRPTPGYASNLGATDFRAWQIETELAARAKPTDAGTMTASTPAAPTPHFAYVVEAPQSERRPAGSVVVDKRAPLPEATTVASR